MNKSFGPFQVHRWRENEALRHLNDEIEQFLYRQSEFLDTRNWEGWIGLFVKTGLYWIPAHPDDPSPKGGRVSVAKTVI